MSQLSPPKRRWLLINIYLEIQWILPSSNQIFHVWFTNEKNENQNSLQTVQDVEKVKKDWTLKNPWNEVDSPCDAGDDKQTKVKNKSMRRNFKEFETWISLFNLPSSV